jgi:hypothetical protein
MLATARSIFWAQGSGANVVALSNVGDQLVNSMRRWKELGMDETLIPLTESECPLVKALS